jgi:hypothetical protein
MNLDQQVYSDRTEILASRIQFQGEGKAEKGETDSVKAQFVLKKTPFTR